MGDRHAVGDRFAVRDGDAMGAVRRSGIVVDFDQVVGLGTLEGHGGGRYLFHCTQIAGGSRAIGVGTAVTFSVMAARRGTWEAADVTPVPAAAQRG